MKSFQRFLSGAFLLGILIAGAHAVPVLDTGFGSQGLVRIAGPSGLEDTSYASAIQPDGRIVVAGISFNDAITQVFVVRFTTTGALDPSFGVGGTVLLPLPATYSAMTPVAVDVMPDGRLLLTSALFNAFLLTRLTPAGMPDPSFGTTGSVVVSDPESYVGGQTVPVRAAVQSDGKLLVISDASDKDAQPSRNGAFVLRLRRFLPNGSVDPTLGAGGVRMVSGLPRDFVFLTSKLATADPDGGFTLVATSFLFGGTYLVVRLTPDATLDTNFGFVGYRSGYDIGNPADTPTALARLGDGSLALFGYRRNAAQASVQDVLWKLDVSGSSSPFGSDGRVIVGDQFRDDSDSLAVPRSIAALPDGAIATAQSRGNMVRISVFESNGALRTSFGDGGTAAVPVAGYGAAFLVGLHVDGAGRMTAAGWVSTYEAQGINRTIWLGDDAVLASVSGSGIARTDFGRGDGTAVWNTPILSDDQIDTVLIDRQGRIDLIGFTVSNKPYDHLLSRLAPNGTLDPSFGNGGRVMPGVFASVNGIARAVEQPDGAIVVANGEMNRFLRSADMFRVTAAGARDTSFNPGIESAGSGSVGLAVRPDGRLLYLSSTVPTTLNGATSVSLQQFLPDGSPDPSFGANGRALFDSVPYATFIGDLALLPDGSAVFAAVSGSRVRTYKANPDGSAAASFAAASLSEPGITGIRGIRLLALSDGTLMTIATAVTGSGSSSQSVLQIVRFNAAGNIVSTRHLAASNSGGTMAAVALPDASVIIARNAPSGAATLARLLPDDQFDQAFGGETGTAVVFPSVTALAVDAHGGLIVGGKDVTSALVARYRIDAPVSSVVAVEYFNIDLGHYFITANAAEMRSIESGGAGPGWQRTGNDFRAWVPEAGVPVGAVPVCRFYGTPGRGPNSHFYTADSAECASVKRDPGWTYEGIAFYVLPAIGGSCGSSMPVWRAYNNGYALNDSNHRYSTQLQLLQSMTAQGWTVEGVAFCAAPD